MDDDRVPELGLVLDCDDPARLAEFWVPALGYRNLGTEGPYVVLYPDGGRAGPKLLLQAVAEPKQAKNRMHLDFEVPDVEEEKRRLVALGASVLRPEPYREHGSTWYVMADPEGNEFCICNCQESGGI